MEGGKDTFQWGELLEQKEERAAGLGWPLETPHHLTGSQPGQRSRPLGGEGRTLAKPGGLGLTALPPALLCPAQPQGAPFPVRQKTLGGSGPFVRLPPLPLLPSPTRGDGELGGPVRLGRGQ